MTTPQLPPLPEPEGVIVVRTQALRAFTADQMRAYALAALSTRPVSESIHAENAKTLQALVDELREMLGVKEWESLKDAVRAISASAAQAGWQPIETATEEDEKCGQVWLLVNGAVVLGYFVSIPFKEYRDMDGHYCGQQDADAYWARIEDGEPVSPTHFQRIARPLPPAHIKKEQEA